MLTVSIIFNETIDAKSFSVNRKIDLSTGEPGLRVGTQPNGIVVSPDGNKLYVTYKASNRVSVIDVGSGSQIRTIPVERFPHAIASDSSINRIYVTNVGSNSISVIDGDTDTLMDPIKLDGRPLDISIDPLFHTAFVVVESSSINVKTHRNDYHYTISEIDIVTNAIVNDRTIQIGNSSAKIAYDPHTDTIFAAISNGSIVAINRLQNISQTIGTADRGPIPTSLAYNVNTGFLYEGNILDDTVNVINVTTNTFSKTNITVDALVTAIAVDPNPETPNIYIASLNNVSVIDGLENIRLAPDIHVDESPLSMAVDPIKHIVYMVNTRSNTISMMDAKTNKFLVGIKFNTDPPDKGNIFCKNVQALPKSSITDQWQEISSNYSMYSVGTQLVCKAESDTQTELLARFGLLGDFFWELYKAVIGGSVFHSWSGDVPLSQQSSSMIHFNASKFGNTITAKFVDQPPVLPQDYIKIIVGLAIPAIAGWIYKKRDFFYKRKRSEYLNRYMKMIDAANNSYLSHNNKEEYSNGLRYIRTQTMDLFGKGAITEMDFLTLNNKISECEKIINKNHN